MPGQSMSPK